VPMPPLPSLTTGKACAVLPADAGGRTPGENTVLGDVAQNRAVAASGKLADCNAAHPNHGGQRRIDRCRRN
jgi:hypothetical protein